MVDMGSLNGTLLNSHVIRHPEMPQRNWSEPFELSNGDVISLVQITWHDRRSVRFGVGLASDAMSLRRGKKLPMEDVCYYQWPFPEIDQGWQMKLNSLRTEPHSFYAAGLALVHCFKLVKTLPKMVADMLSVSERRERVVSLSDASEILRVQITWHDRRSIPSGVGMASDAMSLRRGGKKKLPVEVVCYYQWPFPEIDQVLSLLNFVGGASLHHP
ncbi:hypothetical protein ACLOJK_026010 [Asimina triloba]